MSSQPTSRREHDDYRAIIVKALADRLAEAFAEWLHRARAPRVVRAGRAARRRGAAARALPRHPARVRLPGLPRPQREGEALRPARRARRGARADRELRDDARRGGQRYLPRAPRRALLRGGPDRARSARGLRGSKRGIRATSRAVVAIKSLVASALLALLFVPAALADNPTVKIDRGRPGVGDAGAADGRATSASAGAAATTNAAKLTGTGVPRLRPEGVRSRRHRARERELREPARGRPGLARLAGARVGRRRAAPTSRARSSRRSPAVSSTSSSAGPEHRGGEGGAARLPEGRQRSAPPTARRSPCGRRAARLRCCSDFVFFGNGRLEYSLNVDAPARYRQQLVPFEADMARILVKRGARPE